jgi:hypothetical protein
VEDETPPTDTGTALYNTSCLGLAVMTKVKLTRNDATAGIAAVCDDVVNQTNQQKR